MAVSGYLQSSTTCLNQQEHEANTMKQNWALTAYHLHKTTGETLRITVKGRDRWALESLIRAGRKGCTPIDHPGPRWSAYVFNLRGAGVEIETITELHEGDFKGHHARYICRSTVTPFHLAAQGGAAA